MSNSSTAPWKRQSGFLVAGDHLGDRAGHDGAEHIGRHGEEHVTVGGVAGRRRRHHSHLRNIVAPKQFGVIGQRGFRPLDRLRRELPCGVHSLAQPHDAHLAMDIAQLAVDRVGDQQPDRVGAAVDRGDPRDSRPYLPIQDARHARLDGQHGQRLVAERIHASDPSPASARSARADTSPVPACRRRRTWCPAIRSRRARPDTTRARAR